MKGEINKYNWEQFTRPKRSPERYMTKVVLDEVAKEGIKKWLAGEITSRDLGKVLGCSHQQAINFSARICRQWFKEGKIKI